MEFGRPNTEDKKMKKNYQPRNSLPLSLRKEIRNKMLSFLAYEYEAMMESNVYSTLWDISRE